MVTLMVYIRIRENKKKNEFLNGGASLDSNNIIVNIIHQKEKCDRHVTEM